jgi:pSer/pThr/pTyr-binding forkhead associated (FHA) protein
MDASHMEGTSGSEKLRLKVVSGNAVGDMIEVQDELVIGRQATGVGTLANDIEISRSHARIRGEPDGRFVIEDLGSTNGTYVNGRRIDVPTTLEVGDRIEIGATALVVQVSTMQPTPAASETIVPTPGTAPAPAPTPELSPFTLRIDVDPAAGKATVSLDDDSDQVSLVHEDGRWRLDDARPGQD